MYFSHPFTCLVSGPTKCGKTTWAIRLVKNANSMISPPPQKIIWCYNEWQPAYIQLPATVHLQEGVPDLVELKETSHIPKLLILDDFMQNLRDDKLTALFTRGAHHWNVSIVHLVQNLFHNSRTARVNAHYIVLMRNPCDKLQVQTLGRQIYPGQTKFFNEAYKDATERKFGYLLADLSPDLDDEYRLRTCVFPDELQYVYVPK